MSKTKTEDWRGSAEYWAKLVDVYSAMLRSNRQSYIYIPLAGALEKLGRTREAIDTLEDGLALLPESRAALALLGRLKYDSGDVEGARSVLTKVIGRQPDLTAAVFLLCMIYEREGDIASALETSAALLDYYPDSKRVRELVDRYARMDERLRRAMAKKSAPEKVPAEPRKEPEEAELIIAPDIAETVETREIEREAPEAEEAPAREEALFAEEDELTETMDIILADDVSSGAAQEAVAPPIRTTGAQIDLTDTWFGETGEDEVAEDQSAAAAPVAEENESEADTAKTDEALLRLESMMERIYHLKNTQRKERTKSNV